MSDKAYYIAQTTFAIAIILLSLSAAGCEVIEGIFKAGMWVGVVGVVLVVAMIAGVFRLIRR